MNAYSIILADDHTMLRQGLRRILEERSDLSVAGETGDGLELLDLVKKLAPHMVVLDISMPNIRGLEAIHEIRRIHPAVKILVLTMHNDEEYLFQAISSGADGYLLKEDADRELFSAVDKVRRGEIYISPHLTERLTAAEAMKLRETGKPYPESGQLSLREREVLKMIAEGKSSKEIADLLSISVRTAEHHRSSIMNKLNLSNTADLVRYAVRKGFA